MGMGSIHGRSARPSGPRSGLAAVALGFLVAVAPCGGGSAFAFDIPGGGVRATDCLAVFRTAASPSAGGGTIRCRDGDPACDDDGAVDGRCVFPVAVCANASGDPQCSSPGVAAISVAHAVDNGDPLFDPAFQALQGRIDTLDFPVLEADRCTTPTRVTVSVQGPLPGNRCRGGRKRIRVSARPAPGPGVREAIDVDALRLACLPAAPACDPRDLFAGTFDRIQRQVFDRRCALSGCHDSQTRAADLLLEVGAARGNLVGITPTNPSAAAAGWERIAVVSESLGDPARSLLLHKVSGALPAGFGERMPYRRRPLSAAEIELLRLWVAAGAPASGWVPGTDG